MNIAAATIAISTNAEEATNISNDERLCLVTKSLPFRYVFPSITGVRLREIHQGEHSQCPPVFLVSLADVRCEPVYHQTAPQQRYEAAERKEWSERDVIISREGPG